MLFVAPSGTTSRWTRSLKSGSVVSVETVVRIMLNDPVAHVKTVAPSDTRTRRIPVARLRVPQPNTEIPKRKGSTPANGKGSAPLRQRVRTVTVTTPLASTVAHMSPPRKWEARTS